MKTLAVLIAFVISLSGCSPADRSIAESGDNAVADTADTVYTNGNFYTIDEAQPWAEAVAIKDGKFLAVGSAGDVEKMIGEDTKIIDLGHAFVMPGIVDAHTHGIDSTHPQLFTLILDTTDRDSLLESV